MKLKTFLKKKKNRAEYRSGSTMVEVLVAFTVIIIMLAAFSRALALASNLYMHSVDMVNRQEAYNEDYEKQSPKGTSSTVNGSLSLTYSGSTVEFKNSKLKQYKNADGESYIIREP